MHDCTYDFPSGNLLFSNQENFEPQSHGYEREAVLLEARLVSVWTLLL